MIVYYENMNGEKLNLLKAPFRTTKTDWFDADWSESSDGYEKTVTIDVFGKREEFQTKYFLWYKDYFKGMMHLQYQLLHLETGIMIMR